MKVHAFEVIPALLCQRSLRFAITFPASLPCDTLYSLLDAPEYRQHPCDVRSAGAQNHQMHCPGQAPGGFFIIKMFLQRNVVTCDASVTSSGSVKALRS